jgi:hypothetical protein
VVTSVSLGNGGEVGVGATLQNVTKKQWGKGADAPWSYSHAARRTMFKLLQKNMAGSYENAMKTHMRRPSSMPMAMSASMKAMAWWLMMAVPMVLRSFA